MRNHSHLTPKVFPRKSTKATEGRFVAYFFGADVGKSGWIEKKVERTTHEKYKETPVPISLHKILKLTVLTICGLVAVDSIQKYLLHFKSAIQI